MVRKVSLMLQLSLNKAKEKLMTIRPGLYADFVSGLHSQSITESSSAYELRGAIAIKAPSWDNKKQVWYICDIGESDMPAALAELRANDTDNLDIIMIYARELEGIHCLIFSNIGKEHEDPAIRALSSADSKQVVALTTVEDDGNIFNKSISENIYNDFLKLDNDVSMQLLGIFNGNMLVGAISIENRNHNEVIIVRHLFVAKNHRGKGYASRLVKSALTLYPEARYSYSCGTDNHASVATAKATEFTFEGTYDFL